MGTRIEQAASPKDFRSVIPLKHLLHKVSTINNKKTWIWIGMGLIAVPALHVYYVQEILAAFIAFALLFVAVSTAVFTVFFLVRTIKRIIAWVTPKVRPVMHRGVDTVEGVIASPVWAQAGSDLIHFASRSQVRPSTGSDTNGELIPRR